MLSIEITRECPLSCPGCYAFREGHLGGEITLSELSDLREPSPCSADRLELFPAGDAFGDPEFAGLEAGA